MKYLLVLTVFMLSSCTALLPDLEMDKGTGDTDSSTDSDTTISGAPGSVCSENGDCDSGNCVNELCCSSGECCNEQILCSAYTACNMSDFVCFESCSSNGNDNDDYCAAGYHCDAGQCMEDMTQGPCDEDGDCASGECVDSQCCEHAGLCCAIDDDCPELFDGCAGDDSRTCVFSTVKIPASGQAGQCWGVSGQDKACSSINSGQDYYGQDGHYDIYPAKEYSGDTLDVIMDVNSGLYWHTLVSDPLNFDDAVLLCDTLVTSDSRDSWYLPTRTQLLTLQNYSPDVPGGLSDKFQNDSGAETFWSSTKLAGDESSTAWVVNFSSGIVTRLGVESNAPAVLCVQED